MLEVTKGWPKHLAGMAVTNPSLWKREVRRDFSLV
jgi:hypothetical protein